MARYRFALKPRWILSHLFVLAMCVGMINLGMWQLHRLDEKRDRNAQVQARAAEAPVAATAVAAPGAFDQAKDQEFRQVTASGTYVADDEVLVRSRSNNGAPGSWVLTPLDLGDGTGILVNRGWIENNGRYESVPRRFRARSGEVSVEGLVRGTETKGTFGSTDPPTGRLENLARADVARVDRQVDLDLLPFVLQLQEQDPPVRAGDPMPVPAPELDEGPHLSYAVQWFTFTAMTVVIYALILRRKARDIERAAELAALDGADAAGAAAGGEVSPRPPG